MTWSCFLCEGENQLALVIIVTLEVVTQQINKQTLLFLLSLLLPFAYRYSYLLFMPKKK